MTHAQNKDWKMPNFITIFGAFLITFSKHT
jgi:hypothetical protein